MDFSREAMESFTQPDCDRRAWIQGRLRSAGIESHVVQTGDSRHVMVQFRPESYNAMFRFKTILVHYDRFPGSPGANDNSSACLQVMDFAMRLNSFSGVHNTRIFFTDGEEMGGAADAGVSSQGAFGLASLYKKLGITNDDVYVFDCCGRGIVPVLGLPDLSSLNKRSEFVRNFQGLAERTESLLKKSTGKWLRLPVPYSDNAGFLACGIPAVAITLLPADEAQNYMRELQKDRNLEAAVMNRAREESSGRSVPDFVYREKMPPTWRMLHTQFDNILSLTPESFSVMHRILDTLALQKSV